jgi:hypothetical protein
MKTVKILASALCYQSFATKRLYSQPKSRPASAPASNEYDVPTMMPMGPLTGS